MHFSIAYWQNIQKYSGKSKECQIHCGFVDNSSVMSESKENLLNTLLINAFYLASIARDAPTARKKLLGSNPEAFSEVWSSLMQHDFKDSDRPWLGILYISDPTKLANI